MEFLYIYICDILKGLLYGNILKYFQVNYDSIS